MDWDATGAAFARFLLTRGKAHNTVRTYRATVRIFYAWCLCHETDPHLADRSVFQTWLVERIGDKTRRVPADIAALKLYAAYLIDAGLRTDDPTVGLKAKRSKTLPTAPLELCDLETLLGACHHERDRIIILMLPKTGLRISELAGVCAEHIDWQTGELNIMGKGSKERPIVIPSDLLGRLRIFLGMFPSGPLFRSLRRQRPMSGHQIRKIVYTIADRAGMGGVHPHRFRSTFATEFMQQFGDIQALQGIMGHESIETTARYSEMTKRQRGLRMMRDFDLGV